MKTCSVLIALVAIGLFAVPAQANDCCQFGATGCVSGPVGQVDPPACEAIWGGMFMPDHWCDNDFLCKPKPGGDDKHICNWLNPEDVESKMACHDILGKLGGDTCESAIPAGKQLDLCQMSDGLTDPEGDGGYDNCWGGSGLKDMWYSFTATDTIMRLRTDLNSKATDTHFQAYSGPCAGLVEMPDGCSEDEITAGWFGDICVETNVAERYHVQLGMYANDQDDPGPSYNWCNYYTFVFALDVSHGGSVCGDGIIACDGSEDCDDPDMGACEHGCRDCVCLPPPVPMLPAAGLVGLGVLLVTGGALVFGRRRK